MTDERSDDSCTGDPQLLHLAARPSLDPPQVSRPALSCWPAGPEPPPHLLTSLPREARDAVKVFLFRSSFWAPGLDPLSHHSGGSLGLHAIQMCDCGSHLDIVFPSDNGFIHNRMRSKPSEIKALIQYLSEEH